MAKQRSIVLVKVIKKFEYPKSMLHKELFLQDALNKARNDMQVFVDEIVNNDHAQLRHDMFEFEAEEQLGFKFRNRHPVEEGTQKGGDVVSLMKACKALTTRVIEAKYGPLNPETNPQLFEHEPEVRSKDGAVVVREEQWYMKEKIEREFYDVYEDYSHLLRNAK